jgi:hypothetical protein
MEMSVQLHAPPLYPRNRTPVRTEQEAAWAVTTARTFRRREDSVALAGIRTPDHPSRSLAITGTTLPHTMKNTSEKATYIQQSHGHGLLTKYGRVVIKCITSSNIKELHLVHINLSLMSLNKKETFFPQTSVKD